MSFTTDANGNKQYKIADHLGSTRLAVSGAGTDGQYNHAPYGKREVVAATVPTRKGFIDREQDVETGLGNFGVRAFDEDEGVFPSVDALWEDYRSLSPYHYVGNNPEKDTDPSGKGGGPHIMSPQDFMMNSAQSPGEEMGGSRRNS
jgi:RHS repeat-associated protein